MASAEALQTIAPYLEYSSRSPAEVAAELESYAKLLVKWQRVQNLVSRETLDDLWRRHVADSLQVLKQLTPADSTFLDLGSGGGFPAIPIAIALRDRPGFSAILVEPNNRKASFLRTVARELGLAISVEARRTEEIDSRETFRPDVVTSRALASLNELCRFAAPFFGPSTRAIFHKGREHVEELEESRVHWHYDVLIVPSATSADGVLLEIRNLRAKSAR